MVLAAVTKAQTSMWSMRDKMIARARGEEGLEGIAVLLIVLGIAVLVTVAILVATKGSLWGAADNSLDQVDSSVATFDAGTRP